MDRTLSPSQLPLAGHCIVRYKRLYEACRSAGGEPAPCPARCAADVVDALRLQAHAGSFDEPPQSLAPRHCQTPPDWGTLSFRERLEVCRRMFGSRHTHRNRGPKNSGGQTRIRTTGAWLWRRPDLHKIADRGLDHYWTKLPPKQREAKGKMNSLLETQNETQPCECCGDGVAHLELRDMPFEYGVGANARTLSAEMSVWVCVSCDAVYTAEGSEEAEYDAICDHLGRLRTSEIIAARQREGATQEEFARSLGVGRVTLARWESRKQIQSTVYDQLIRRRISRFNSTYGRHEKRSPTFRTDVSHRAPAAASFSLMAA